MKIFPTYKGVKYFVNLKYDDDITLPYYVVPGLKLSGSGPVEDVYTIETPDSLQDYLCQQLHCLLKHKMLQFVLKISLYMAPTCFGPSWTIIREHMMEPC